MLSEDPLLQDRGAADMNQLADRRSLGQEPRRVVGAVTPPIFMMYGKADTLLPSNQAVLLCNKLGGAAIDDGGGSRYRAVYPCGSGWLHLFEEAKHGLDICLPGFCPSGSSASVPLVKDSLKKARRWLIDGNVENSVRNPGFETGSTATFTWDGVVKRSGAKAVAIASPSGWAQVTIKL